MDVIDVEAFVADGFAKVEAVVPREVAEAAQALLWERIGLSPDDPSGWTRPVVWAADMNGEGPFGRIMRSERLAAALDAVAGAGGWVPRDSVGNVPIRFPVSPPADDRGWHIDANTAGPDGVFGVSGRPGTLLVLVLLSQVGPADAPTRVRAGSQRDVAALLDERVRDVMKMGALFERAGAGRPVALATGSPGDVYVVHPFTVHAAQEHGGGRPRFMAQTPVFLTSPLGPGDGTALGRAAGFDRL